MVKEIDHQKRLRNPALYSGLLKRWRANNREKHRASNREWTKRNSAKARAATLRWQKANRDKARANKARRRACEINARPAWADANKIREFFTDAERKTRETGIVHHVDHIVPLNSPIVCGLHCEFNLQVIPGADNISKSNRRWPDMPDESVWEWVASDEFKQQWKLLCSDLPKRQRPPSMWEAIPPEERSRMATERNLNAWKRRTPEQRAEIGRRIAAGQIRSKMAKAAR